jgi:ABC-2 type transport system ATP-binding protein
MGTAPPTCAGVGEDGLAVEGMPISLVGRAALRAGVELHELREEHTDLEDVFLALTSGEES